ALPREDEAESRDQGSLRAHEGAARRDRVAAEAAEAAAQAVLELRGGRDLVLQEWGRLDRRRLALPDAAAAGRQGAGQGDRPAAHDGLGRHLDARQEGAASELRLPVDAVRD